MRLTKAQYSEHLDEKLGYCKRCKAMTTNVDDEQDEDVECVVCGSHAVLGVELALYYKLLRIMDDDVTTDREGDNSRKGESPFLTEELDDFEL